MREREITAVRGETFLWHEAKYNYQRDILLYDGGKKSNLWMERRKDLVEWKVHDQKCPLCGVRWSLVDLKCHDLIGCQPEIEVPDWLWHIPHSNPLSPSAQPNYMRLKLKCARFALIPSWVALVYKPTVLLQTVNKKPSLNMFCQHLLNISHFHKLFSFPCWPYYVTDNIQLYGRQWKSSSWQFCLFPQAPVELLLPSVSSLFLCVEPWCWQPSPQCPMGSNNTPHPSIVPVMPASANCLAMQHASWAPVM